MVILARPGSSAAAPLVIISSEARVQQAAQESKLKLVRPYGVSEDEEEVGYVGRTSQLSE